MSSSNEDRFARRRQEILDAAERVFGSHGYAATTIDAIAEDAGVSKGSIYNYFQSKEDLFVRVFSRVVETGHSEVAKLVESDLSPPAKLDALVDYWSGKMGHYQQIGRIVLEFWATAARQDGQGGLAETFHRMHAEERKLIGAILAQGIAGGQFRSQTRQPVAAALILAILDGILIQSIMEFGPTVDEPLLTGLKRAIRAALGAQTDPAGPDET